MEDLSSKYDSHLSRLRAILDASGVNYSIIAHEQTYASAQTAPEADWERSRKWPQPSF